jgi:hypothetical protein
MDNEENVEYEKFMESMSEKCRCTFGPCAGVLAGGFCDEIIYDDTLDEYDEDEDYEG